MANVMGAMKSLSGADTTNVPSNILAIIRKRKALAGSDSAKKITVEDDIKAVNSGKAAPMLSQSQRDSASKANKQVWVKHIDSIGYEEVKKKQ